jgi:hypothetical protein
VQGELAEGIGFCVWFPCEFIVRDAVENSFGDLRFLVKLHQNRICQSHDFFSFFKFQSLRGPALKCAPQFIR